MVFDNAKAVVGSTDKVEGPGMYDIASRDRDKNFIFIKEGLITLGAIVEVQSKKRLDNSDGDYDNRRSYRG